MGVADFRLWKGQINDPFTATRFNKPRMKMRNEGGIYHSGSLASRRELSHPERWIKSSLRTWWCWIPVGSGLLAWWFWSDRPPPVKYSYMNFSNWLFIVLSDTSKGIISRPYLAFQVSRPPKKDQGIFVGKSSIQELLSTVALRHRVNRLHSQFSLESQVLYG